ncbi:hypothetical protein TSUD_326790 [Trifolium subterraneum]|uniref:ABC transmembrane type-1 domain-containing protein n=1 Tax=Trifolium subterraneum TaxID=3900 RepID=A0A2Z6MHV3_TRISU|nr:hypothetical protein TSUD_326790 [Trifolium subterraneum]
MTILGTMCVREQSEIEQRLLQEEFESSSSSLGEEHEDAFTKASIWSILTFMWLNPVFKTGQVRKLEHVDVPSIPHSETSVIASSMLEESIGKQKLRGGSLIKAIILPIWKSLAFNACLAGVNTIASYVGPLLISKFVKNLLSNNVSSTNQYGLILASTLFLSKMVESVTQRQWSFGAQRIGIRVRAGLMAHVYSKCLMVKCGGPGNITNMINVDVERVGDFFNHIHGLWVIPLQTILALAILCINLGWIPSLAAFSVTTLVMVCNTPLATMQQGLTSKIMDATDARLKMTSETIENMQILKLHSWELIFMQKLLQLRDTEMSWVLKYFHACSAVATLFWTTPTLVSVITFGACILVKTELTSATVLSALATFRILQEPIYNMPDLISKINQTKECLLKMLSDKTVVYATHQMQFLEAADVILVMKDGQIVESGSYIDLIACPDSRLYQLMADHKETLKQIQSQEEDDSVSCSRRPCSKNPIEIAVENSQNITMDDEKRTREEEAMTGRVKWSVYSTFVTLAYSGALVPVILLCQIFFQVMQMSSSYWISWAAEQSGRVNNVRLIVIFSLLSGGSSIFMLGRTVLMTIVSAETARRLYLGMTTSVFRAPISFFDKTPSSRILSRSSTDQKRADIDIPYRLAGLVFAFIQLFCVISLMCLAAWQVLPLIVVVFGISIWYLAYYSTTARELARMAGIRMTPILHHFTESISGATTIRCFDQEKTFLTKAMYLIDDYSRVAFHNHATMEWVSVRINFLFNLVYYVVLVILVTLPRSSIDPSKFLPHPFILCNQ